MLFVIDLNSFNSEHEPAALLAVVEKLAGLGIAGPLNPEYINRDRLLRHVFVFDHDFSVGRRVIPLRPLAAENGGDE